VNRRSPEVKAERTGGRYCDVVRAWVSIAEDWSSYLATRRRRLACVTTRKAMRPLPSKSLVPEDGSTSTPGHESALSSIASGNLSCGVAGTQLVGLFSRQHTPKSVLRDLGLMSLSDEQLYSFRLYIDLFLNL